MKAIPKRKDYLFKGFKAYAEALEEWAKEADTEMRILKLLITKREQLQLEYINLLGEEISSMASIAHIHGWRSKNVEKGKALREKLEMD